MWFDSLSMYPMYENTWFVCGQWPIPNSKRGKFKGWKHRSKR